MRRKLVITGGARKRELQLVGRIVVGRDPGCEISHDDSLLSRRHAEFLTVGDTVTIRDLGSRNGVFVNGARAVEQVLEPGDVVQIGPLRAQFVVEQAPVSILPEDIDSDRTAVIRKAFATLPSEPGQPPAAAVATIDGDDDEVTRMVPAPRMPASPDLTASAEAAASSAEAASRQRRKVGPASFDDGDTPTAFIPAPEIFSAAPTTSRPAASVSRATIFFEVLALVMVVLAAAMIPVLAAASPVWLALPVFVACAGAYLVSASIHRRVSAALNDKA